MQPWALVSPASRGIGLELARRLLQTTKVPIVATARKDLDQTRENILRGLDGVSEDRLHILKIDVLGRCFVVLHLVRNWHVVQYTTYML
jgi:NAD(P)-dependent dehydrogenase (short-subunit alcohol dehydrogenase family)